MPPRIALITGASSGIGYAAALAFAREGTHVIVTARREDRLAQLADEIGKLPAPHGEILTVGADVREAGAMEAAVQAAVERFGRLDILVANAGLGHRGALIDTDWNEVETLLRTNIDGVLHSIRAAVPEIRKSGGGHIVIISSIVANTIAPYMALYAASKAFVSSLAQSLRRELADDNIWVTDMRVGRTKTEFNEKRLGKGGRTSTSIGPSTMNVEKVADAVVKATHKRQKMVTLRPIDRLIVLANTFVPDIIASFVKNQYK
jgi:short-subunit dehydrogenase